MLMLLPLHNITLYKVVRCDNTTKRGKEVNLTGKDVFGRAVGGVHVQEVHFAGLQSRVISQARLPPHVSSVQYHLQQHECS